MKTRSYMVDTARQIWCFPDFKKLPDSQQKIDGDPESLNLNDKNTTLGNIKSLQDFDERFPDPLFFCIGIYLSLQKLTLSQRTHRRLQTTLSGARREPDI